MTKKALKALKQSIAHHERMLAGKEQPGERPNGKSCPLCQEFGNILDCRGCPIRKRTGRPCCEATPYWDDENFNLQDHWEVCTDSVQTMVRWEQQAKAELEFLKSLLPKGERI